MKKILKIAAIGALVLLPVLSFAQTEAGKPVEGLPPDVGFVPPSGGVQQVVDIIDAISRVMLYGLLVLAGVFIVYAAYLYLTAAGDAEKVKHASNVIIYAAVAIGVGLLSRVVVAIARGLVQ